MRTSGCIETAENVIDPNKYSIPHRSGNSKTKSVNSKTVWFLWKPEKPIAVFADRFVFGLVFHSLSHF